MGNKDKTVDQRYIGDIRSDEGWKTHVATRPVIDSPKAVQLTCPSCKRTRTAINVREGDLCPRCKTAEMNKAIAAPSYDPTPRTIPLKS